MNTLENVVQHYHGIPEEIEEAFRHSFTAKLDINTICRIDAATEVLKIKRQESVDTLVSIGFESLIDADEQLAEALKAAFLKAAQKNLKGGE